MAETIQVSEFDSVGLENWSRERFAGDTRFELVADDDQTVLSITSRSGATGLVREMKIDIAATPCLHWQWQVQQAPNYGEDAPDTRRGDDFAARIYVVRKAGFMNLRSVALNYVWLPQGRQPAASWNNPFVDQVRMVPVARPAPPGQWQSVVRNVRNDFARYLDKDIETIHAIGIMSDSDNTGSETRAHFSDIRFSNECVVPGRVR